MNFFILNSRIFHCSQGWMQLQIISLTRSETLRDRDLADDENVPVSGEIHELYETGDLYVIYSRFLERNWLSGTSPCTASGAKARYEDVYPVLYMKYRLSPDQSGNGIKHLVVDEMQDYSRLQYQFFK